MSLSQEFEKIEWPIVNCLMYFHGRLSWCRDVQRCSTVGSTVDDKEQSCWSSRCSRKRRFLSLITIILRSSLLTVSRHGLPQVSCCLSYLQRSAISLHIRRSAGHRPEYLDSLQWNQARMIWQIPRNEIAANKTLQEDGSNCSIFSFDVTANKSRLPMARNAVKRLRTLRHPGVLKVLDTVEVKSSEVLCLGNLTNIQTDRNIYLYCYGASDSFEMAY